MNYYELTALFNLPKPKLSLRCYVTGLIYVIAANKFDIYGDMFGPPSYNINYHYDDSSFKMVT